MLLYMLSRVSFIMKMRGHTTPKVDGPWKIAILVVMFVDVSIQTLRNYKAKKQTIETRDVGVIFHRAAQFAIDLTFRRMAAAVILGARILHEYFF